MNKLFSIATTLLILSFSAYGGAITHTTKVTSIMTYGTYGTNDIRYRNQVQVGVETPALGCDDGFYISADDAENNPSLVSFLLSAFHADSMVRIAAYDDQLQSGSKKFCRIANISLIKNHE